MPRTVRVDAQRNIDTLLKAAASVFAKAGVDAPVRDIADAAGVGIATMYRHFPQRTDLIVAVFRREVDACAAAASTLAATHTPGDALTRWIFRYMDFIAAKRGLAAALHSGEAAFDSLPAYFKAHLEPALRSLLDSAVAAGAVRDGVDAFDLLQAVASLCTPSRDGSTDHARRMVGLLVDGLRYGAGQVG
ncbi:MAG: helix-turn-helix transcriptional regulator [Gemmatimonadaceae bacterium]|nr:helix-turn-helix transcriptional regulator [Gemmatimonadaceae bacterium]